MPRTRDKGRDRQVADFAFVDTAPPPDMKRRELIFDSLAKIINKEPQKHQRGVTQDSRGTHIFTWGAGYHGQLGRKFQRGHKKYSTIPQLVELPHVVRQIACGGLHTAVCTEAGTVFTWGDGRHGQLGHSPESYTMQPTPVEVEDLGSAFVTQVAAGRYHTVCLTDKGALYSWGSSRYGQAGHGDRQTQKMPKRIDVVIQDDDGKTESIRDFNFIACGEKHSFALTSKGRAFSWGCNEHGQIGHLKRKTKDNSDILSPTEIETMKGINVTFVACGAIHSALLDEAGSVYVCGFGEHFFPDDVKYFYYEPQKVQFNKVVVQLACGQSHILALTDDGNVYAWGGGNYGQLGHGVKGNLSAPRLVLRGKSVAAIASGRYHSIAVTKHGIMYSWGCGENGQLGQGTDENYLHPKVVESVIATVVGQTACGEHHTAALSSAPWSKISADLAEWQRAAREEHTLIQNFVKETNRGLTAKDLVKIEEQMDEWRVQYEESKRAAAQAEAEETQRDIQSIAGSDNLLRQELIHRNITNAVEAIPEAEPEQAEEKPAEEEQTPSEGGHQLPSVTQDEHDHKAKLKVKLPEVAKRTGGRWTASNQDRGLAALLSPRVERAASPKSPSGSKTDRYYLPNIPRGASARTNETSASETSPNPGAAARTAFLKETAQTIARMTKIVSAKGETETKHTLAQMRDAMFSLRKEYDSLRHLSERKQKRLAELRSELATLLSSADSLEHTKDASQKRLQALHMQLDTVTIKIAETEENKKNYELNISHLKEEEFEHFNELEALRKQNAENNNMFKKMNEMKISALEEKDRAEQELAEFAKEIQQYKKFVTAQLAQFNQVLEKVRQQNHEREKSTSKRSKKARTKVQARIKDLEAKVAVIDEESNKLQAQLEGLDVKLHHYEARFQEISAATGLSDPEAIINKFFFKGEIKEQLEMEIDDKTKHIAELEGVKAALKKQLNESKDSFRDRRWRDVDELEENARNINVRAKKMHSEYEERSHRLAYAQEGILNLLRMLDEIEGRNETQEPDAARLWKPDECAQIFNHISEAMSRINKKVGKSRAQAQRQKEEEKTLAPVEQASVKRASLMDAVDTLSILQKAKVEQQSAGEAGSAPERTPVAAQ